MPLFFYRAYGPNGELVEGQLDATSEDVVGDILWTRNLVPFEVAFADASKMPWWRRDFGLARASFSLPQLAGFTREFGTLTSAGIPLANSLRVIGDQMATGRPRSILDLILKDVLNGAPLSSAMQKHPESFSTEYVSVISAGETGGRLGHALDELADLLERRVELRARILSALVYPAILVVLSILSLIVIIGVLIPNIAPIFSEAGATAPRGIAFLMLLHDHWQVIVLAAAGVAIAAAGSAALTLRRPPVRIAFDRLKLKAPILGTFLLGQETARFARTLGTLLEAGVPLLSAAASASATVKNAALAASLHEAINRVREGARLDGALRDCTPLPPLALRMISIGEQAAKMSRMLLRVAAMLEQQTQRSVDRFMTVLTPTITLFVALMVGLLIVTIMNAVLSLNDIAIG